MSEAPGPEVRRSWPAVRRLGLPAAEVAADQRARVYVAFTEALPERGYDGVSVRHLVEAAGISRRTFYELFEGKEEAFLGAHEEALGRLEHAVREACAGPGEWPARVRGAIAAALEFAAADPPAARLAAGEPWTVGPHLRHCQEVLLAGFEPALRKGRGCAQAEPAGVTETGLVGGAAGIVLTRLRSDGGVSVRELTPQLTAILLTPYVGRAEAERVAAEDDR